MVENEVECGKNNSCSVLVYEISYSCRGLRVGCVLYVDILIVRVLLSMFLSLIWIKCRIYFLVGIK